MTCELLPVVQLHWQNRANPQETEFIAQGGPFQSSEEFDAWATEVFERRRSGCPEGWVPMVCTEDSEYFVLAATPSAPAAADRD